MFGPFGPFARIRCELTPLDSDKVNLLSLPTPMGAALLPWQRPGDSEFRCHVTAGLKLVHTVGVSIVMGAPQELDGL